MPAVNKTQDAVTAQPSTNHEQKENLERLNTIQEQSSEQQTALLAYQCWEERGRPHGSDEEDWLWAEQAMRHGDTLP